MTTVFLSGSRSIRSLNDQIRNRLSNITHQSFSIVLGDANGADKALQSFLKSIEYPHVTIYCAGRHCRNNLGSWPVRTVDVRPGTKGREFYAEKDKVMADIADYGFVLWDGKSSGAIANVVELLKRCKTSLVYVSAKKAFESIASASDLRSIISGCEERHVRTIDRKIALKKSLAELESPVQAELAF